jgi:cytoskeletal protein RodZ
MDEELSAAHEPTVGERLRAAREGKGLSLEDIAAQTRIPQRHLEAIETAQWDRLPAPTYTVGFAKSYASAVGLDRSEVGDQLREEMGGQRFASTSPEVFEAADPARTMPKWLVIAAVVAVLVVVVGMTWFNNRSLEEPDQTSATNQAEAPAAPSPVPTPGPQAPAPQAAAQGPVVLSASGPSWIQVTDQGKTLFSGELQAGQSFTVPQNAVAPLLKAGKPETIEVKVGSAIAPQVGPSGKLAKNVSLKPQDLMRGPTPQAQPNAPAPQPAAPAQ